MACTLPHQPANGRLVKDTGLFDFFSDFSTGARRASAIRLTLAALVVLAVGWSIFWLVAWWRVGAELDARAQDGQGRGYSIVCGDRSISGYPLRLVITCRDPVLTFQADGGAIALRFPRLVSRAWLHAPSLIAVNMQGPMDVEKAGAPWRLHTDWSSMTIGIRGQESRLDRFSVWGDDVTVACTQCPADINAMRIAAFQTHLRRASGRRDYNAAASFVGVRSTPLDTATGNTTPGIFALIGSVSQFHIPESMKLSDEVERWRTDGGRINLNTFSLDKGTLHAEINGNAGLDAGHRVDGAFEIGARNAASLVNVVTGSLSPILQLAIGAALKQIDVATSRSEDTPIFRMSGAIQGGSVSIGPIQGVMSIPPLY